MTSTGMPRRRRWCAVAGGAAFLLSGAALLVYIATGWSLALVLAAFVVVGAAAVALLVWPVPGARRAWLTRVQVGVPVGLIATVAYDLSRGLLAQAGHYSVSPFKAFPLFGEALLGDGAAGPVQLVAGVLYHLLNGVAFGTAYAVWFGHRPWWWGIGFGLGLEAVMLAIYPGWLDIRALGEFTQMSVFGHVVYGAVLGVGTSWLLRRRGGPSAAGAGHHAGADALPSLEQDATR